MGILKGKQFYSWEIERPLIVARGEAAVRYMSQLQFIDADIDKNIVAVNNSLGQLVAEAGDRIARDVGPNAAAPKLYRKGDSWWNTIDSVLSLQAVNTPGVREAVAALPSDPAAGPTWLDNKPLVFGGLAAALGIGYYLTRK